MRMYYSRNGVQYILTDRDLFFREKCETTCSFLQYQRQLIDPANRGGLEFFTGFIRYGDDFRMLRRFTTQYFNSHDHYKMYPLLQTQVKILLRNLLESPYDFDAHLAR